jgi:LysM repeat protein
MPSKYRSKYIILTVFTVLLTSCSTSIERFKTVNNDERKNQVNQYSEDQKATFKGAYSNYWIVSSGETLEFIARSTEVPLEDIAYYNSLSYPYKLNDGMRLYIAKRKLDTDTDSPASSQFSSKNEGVSGVDDVYYVKSGDTISSIAMKFGINAKHLIELNKIVNPSLIYVGQELKIAENKLSQSDKIINTVSVEESDRDGNVLDDVDKSKASMPQFRWPVLGRVINNYGAEFYGRVNNGVYISAPLGSEIRASERGVVTFVGTEDYFGDLIIIKHLNNWVSSYAHLDKSNVLIGDKIEKGDIIGTVGASGIIESPQLYFELRRGTIVQNPTDFLN